MRKAQVVSIDLILAVLVFVSLIVGFFYVISIFSQNDSARDTETDTQKIPPALQSNSSKFAFIDGNQIDTEKLVAFSRQDYKELQNSLGLINDFCIYLEDENGNIIPIDGMAGIGSDKVRLGSSAQYKCGTVIS